MKRNQKLALIWGGMYILCVVLGFVQTQNGLLQALFALLSIGFFIPGGILLYEAVERKNRALVKRIRILCLTSLLLTVLVLIGNVLTLPAAEAVGNRMHALLVVVSAPMMCSQFWAISLFLWACLLMGTFFKETKRK